MTRPDGTEINKMVWADHEHQAKVDPLIEQLLQQCPDSQLQQALLTRLTERLFDEAESKQVQILDETVGEHSKIQ